MLIQFDRLLLHNFKNHQHFYYPLGKIMRLTGTNGAGKSTIGEAITWCLYGTDPLGNTLIKGLSPEPTNYPFDYVAVELLLMVDDKQVLLERRIEDGDTKYYINEVPAKATPFKELVESLFDKQLFLSLFSPAYFFSQKWEDQRALVLKNVLSPASKDVLSGLPKPQADKLSELLKKHNIDDLDTLHRDNKNRQDKSLIAAKERVKTLQEQVDQLPKLSAGEVHKLNEQLADFDAKIAAQEEKQKKADEAAKQLATKGMERSNIKTQLDGLATQHKAKKENPPAEACETCERPFDEVSKKAAEVSHKSELARLRDEYNELLERYNALTEEITAVRAIAESTDPEVLRIMRDTRHELGNMIQQATGTERLNAALTEAKAKEKETEASFKDSVFVLDAIKSFRAKEAELMAAKVQGMFKTLTIKLFQENKGDGERKPFFEIEKDDKPYRKLSRGESMIAGLEVINVLSEQNGVIAPVFFDNAESVAKYKQPAGQLIEAHFVFPTEENNFGEFKIEEVSPK